MQRMWRRTFAAVAGLLAVASASSAQSPPNPFPVRTAPAPLQGVVPASGGFNGPVNLQGSLSGIRYGDGPVARVANQPPIPSACYAPGCANGCGNYKSDLGFIFGSCKSFFEPCGPAPCNGHGHGGIHGLLKQRCGVHPWNAPYGSGYNGCCYDSYMNH